MSSDDVRGKDEFEQVRAKNELQRFIQLFTQSLGPSIFALWFSDSSFSLTDNVLKISAENDFLSQRINNKFGGQLRAAASTAIGSDCEIQFDVAVPVAPSAPQKRQLSLVAGANSGNTSSRASFGQQGRAAQKKQLGEFYFDDENRLLSTAVKEVFQNPGQFSPLLIHGPTGSGKSHLLQWVVSQARKRYGFRRCVYLSAEQFTSYFLAGLRGGKSLPMFRENYRGLDLLAIDDIQFFERKNATLNEFQHTIDNLIRNGKQVVLSADRPPIEINDFGSEIRTRISAGLVCPIKYPNVECRQQIIRNICRQRGFKIPSNVIEFIAERLARDVRRLFGAINRIHAVSVATQQEISIELAQESLCDLFSIAQISTSMHAIEQAVCTFCGVKSVDLKSSSRKKQVSIARMLAMYLSRRHTSNAYSEIGDYFGGRSHSTVIAAQHKVTGWLDADSAIELPNSKHYLAKQAINRIETKLGVA